MNCPPGGPGGPGGSDTQTPGGEHLTIHSPNWTDPYPEICTPFSFPRLLAINLYLNAFFFPLVKLEVLQIARIPLNFSCRYLSTDLYKCSLNKIESRNRCFVQAVRWRTRILLCCVCLSPNFCPHVSIPRPPAPCPPPSSSSTVIWLVRAWYGNNCLNQAERYQALDELPR